MRKFRRRDLKYGSVMFCIKCFFAALYTIIWKYKDVVGIRGKIHFFIVFCLWNHLFIHYPIQRIYQIQIINTWEKNNFQFYRIMIVLRLYDKFTIITKTSALWMPSKCVISWKTLEIWQIWRYFHTFSMNIIDRLR